MSNKGDAEIAQTSFYLYPVDEFLPVKREKIIMLSCRSLEMKCSGLFAALGRVNCTYVNKSKRG